VLDANLPLVTEPEKHVETTIAMPPTVSIEDYEEVKKMWKEQYEKGEVPVSENIQSREQWLEQDTVFITNTLNKLVSVDEKLRTEGLDDLGYILPIFMVNNFSGEEVLVYLKAKLEAAKEVQERITQEKAATVGVKAEEEFVDIAASKQEVVAQEMVMEQAKTIDEPVDETPEPVDYSVSQTPSTPQPTLKKLKEIARLETQKSIDSLTKQILSTQTQQVQELRKKLKFRNSGVSFTVASRTNIPQSKIVSVTSSLLSAILTTTSVIDTIAKTSDVPTTDVKNILTSLAKNIDVPSTLLISSIVKDTGINQVKVIAVTKVLYNNISGQKDTIRKVAENEQLKEQDVQRTVEEQKNLITDPKKDIEKTIALPSTVSVEDYEEVKKMWKEQYEKGEIPTTENITTRKDWLNQDAIFITNTLNKLLSDDEKLQFEGMDDLSYILPVFMSNNFSPEEILVYLKAKLEAAKEVAEQFEKEQALTERLKEQSQEVSVGAKEDKKKEEKTMKVEKEIK